MRCSHIVYRAGLVSWWVPPTPLIGRASVRLFLGDQRRRSALATAHGRRTVAQSHRSDLAFATRKAYGALFAQVLCYLRSTPVLSHREGLTSCSPGLARRGRLASNASDPPPGTFLNKCFLVADATQGAAPQWQAFSLVNAAGILLRRSTFRLSFRIDQPSLCPCWMHGHRLALWSLPLDVLSWPSDQGQAVDRSRPRQACSVCALFGYARHVGEHPLPKSGAICGRHLCCPAGRS